MLRLPSGRLLPTRGRRRRKDALGRVILTCTVLDQYYHHQSQSQCHQYQYGMSNYEYSSLIARCTRFFYSSTVVYKTPMPRLGVS